MKLIYLIYDSSDEGYTLPPNAELISSELIFDASRTDYPDASSLPNREFLPGEYQPLPTKDVYKRGYWGEITIEDLKAYLQTVLPDYSVSLKLVKDPSKSIGTLTDECQPLDNFERILHKDPRQNIEHRRFKIGLFPRLEPGDDPESVYTTLEQELKVHRPPLQMLAAIPEFSDAVNQDRMVDFRRLYEQIDNLSAEEVEQMGENTGISL